MQGGRERPWVRRKEGAEIGEAVQFRIEITLVFF
jgi:hypothetical protein